MLLLSDINFAYNLQDYFIMIFQ